MPWKNLRFGIRENSGRRSETWKIFTEIGKGKHDIYIACRSLGGQWKVSLHRDGKCHVAYSRKYFEEKVKPGEGHKIDRYVSKWIIPSEMAQGTTLAFRIVVPNSSVNISDPNPDPAIHWISLPTEEEHDSTEIAIIITKPSTTVNGWPGKRAMKTILVGSLALENGYTAWCVYRYRKMPTMNVPKGNLRFFKGRSTKDLEDGNLRTLIFGEDECGAKYFIEAIVNGSIKPTQNENAV